MALKKNKNVTQALSIQSFVSYGHVGNCAVLLPLQLLKCRVVPIPTVVFSNHTGYGEWSGEILAPKLVLDLFQGIQKRMDINQFDFFLTGYLGSLELGRTIQEVVIEMKKKNAELLFCMDPVMGDIGRGFFVKPELPNFFKQELLPYADIITPNHFELEYLCNKKIKSVYDAVLECRKLIDQGPKIILVTSFIADDLSDKKLMILAVDSKNAFCLTTPRINVSLNGTGDLTSALFTLFYFKTKNIKKALQESISRVYEMIQKTHKNNSKELLLVDYQEVIQKPSRIFSAVKLK